MKLTSSELTLPSIGPGPRHEGVHIWLPQLSIETGRSGALSIDGRTFVDCFIEGPAVMMPIEGCDFENCNFGDPHGDPRTLMLKPMGARRVTGVIPFTNCIFERCTFGGIGFAGTPEFLDRLVAALDGGTK